MSYRTRRPQLYIMPASGGAGRQISDHPELIAAPEYLPDGTSLLASASYNGFSNIVTVDLRTRAVRKLTSGSTIDTSPEPSPDGSKVVFTSNRGGGPQVYMMSAGGQDVHRISFTGSNYCTSPAWSPKGDRLAFTCLVGGNQIFVVGVEGGRPLQMTFGGNNEDPNWSPDGRYLVFSSSMGKAGGRTLAVLPVASANPKPISIGRSDDTQPAWSPVFE